MKKNTLLLKAGQFSRDAFFVVEGCLRVYELIDGEEKTTAFYTEHQSAVDFSSMASQRPSKKFFVCAEKTTVAILSADKEKALYEKYPRFEKICRIGMEKMMGDNQDQFADFVMLKPEERYEKLQQERPELINRVPQYQIASYLGIKPETLSRIRKRLSKN